MKLEKAIKIVTKLERTLAPTMAADGTDALKLLIEAGKRVLKMRTYKPTPPGMPLPGETKD